MDKCKILLLTANPKGTTPLALDKENREIEAKIRAAKYRDSLELVSKWAVRPDDLLQALLEVRPQVVHFSGHGTTDEIVLVGGDDSLKPVDKEALAYLFGSLKDNIRVVLLNACYSQLQAELITRHIDCVVGMNKPIGDAAAIVFASSFYRAIGFGRSVREAFEVGKAALMLEGIPEDGTPELLARDGVDPREVFLVGDAEQQPTIQSTLSLSNTTEEDRRSKPATAASEESDAEYVRLIRVFVSSPSDVSEERELLEEVIRRINRTDGRRSGVRLETFRWEREVVPQIGPHAQQVVNTQTPSNYDIYLGIMAHRFGTEADGYGSGTEKEFRDAVSRWGKTGKPWILFYFSRRQIDPTKLDLQQYANVRAFQDEVQTMGLHGTYEAIRGAEQAFFEQADEHLRKVVSLLAAVETDDGGLPPGQAARLTIPTSYSEWLSHQCSNIDVVGLRLKEGRRLRLSRVYVPLTTPTRLEQDELAVTTPAAREQKEPPPQLLLDLLDKQSLYVSGPPGAGKSTFCKWVAWLACEQDLPPREIAEPDKYQEQFPTSFCGRLPLLVPLRDFWQSLPARPGQQLTVAELQRVLERWLEQTQPGGLRWKHLAAQLEQGTALVILDGVDEVPLESKQDDLSWLPRTLLLSGISDAITHWSKVDNRVLVTSRPYGLDDGQRQRLGLPHAPIEDLAEPLQKLIVQRYFRIMANDVPEAQRLSKDMISHMRERPGVRELARNPMLLTAMCVIYNEGKRLPQDKFDLYTRIVENVLYNRFPDPTSLERARNQLCVVAHAMHTGDGLDEDRRVPQAQATCDEIERSLESYLETRRWVQSGFDDTLATREHLLSNSGLLLPSGDGKGSFYHFSIQEFLAAQRLWDQASEHKRLVQLFIERAEAAEWHNTLSFLFSTVLGKREDPERGIRLVGALIERITGETVGLAVVVGDCLQILLGREIRLEESQEEAYRHVCLDAIRREVPLRERRLLGLALGQIGDPRIIADLRDPAAYVKVPAGKYRIGDDNKESYTYPPLPAQEFDVEEPFLLSRFPVTNSQFAVFIEEGGYNERGWWSDEGWKWLQGEKVSEPRLWRDHRYNGPNQPVVGVSWYEAEAFCNWTKGRLPSERQWEAAARGQQSLVYPWGNDWEDGICNSSKSKLGVTTPVGLFPRARSQGSELEDMSGNVWEWCNSFYRGDSGSRVLRGGAFYNVTSWARGAFRSDDDPAFRLYSFGFRVARTYR